MTDDDRIARVALNHLAEPGDPRLLRLTRRFGAEEVYAALRAERDLEGALSDVAARLVGLRPHAILEHAQRRGIRFLVPGDAEWPTSLDALADQPPLHQRSEVPLGLWVRGPLGLAGEAAPPRWAAIVGTRAATAYGLHLAGDVAADLAQHGWGVVSGAAFGIDQAAHRGVLAVGGATVAVVACGVDRAYPLAHSELLHTIGERGAVVSEAPPGAAPTRVRFLARNRLIAALAGGTVVVEAAIRSGSLNTANWSERLSRVVMGLPGPVTSQQSEGVHELIRARSGLLVTNGADVREVLAEAGEHLVTPPRAPERVRDALPLRQQQVLDAVPLGRGLRSEAVARRAGIDLASTQSALENLQRLDLVSSSAADLWRLTARAAAP